MFYSSPLKNDDYFHFGMRHVQGPILNSRKQYHDPTHPTTMFVPGGGWTNPYKQCAQVKLKNISAGRDQGENE